MRRSRTSPTTCTGRVTRSSILIISNGSGSSPRSVRSTPGFSRADNSQRTRSEHGVVAPGGNGGPAAAGCRRADCAASPDPPSLGSRMVPGATCLGYNAPSRTRCGRSRSMTTSASRWPRTPIRASWLPWRTRSILKPAAWSGVAWPGVPHAHPSGPDLPVPARPAAQSAPRVQRSVAWSGSVGSADGAAGNCQDWPTDEPVEPSPESPP